MHSTEKEARKIVACIMAVMYIVLSVGLWILSDFEINKET